MSSASPAVAGGENAALTAITHATGHESEQSKKTTQSASSSAADDSFAIKTRSRPIVDRSFFGSVTYNNPFPEWEKRGFLDVVKWIRMRRAEEKANPPEKPPATPTPLPPQYSLQKGEFSRDLPIVTPNFELLNNPPSSSATFTWIGHATCLVQLNGVTILTDAVFSEVVSPMPSLAGPQRYRPPPCTIDQLPPIDFIFLSHNHFDHTDLPSQLQLASKAKTQYEKTGRRCRWVAPLGLGEWISNQLSLKKDVDVIELDWWQRKEIDNIKVRVEGSEEMVMKQATIVVVPAQHWSRRSLMDTCQTLWGGVVMIVDGAKFFFSGDTGYCSVFKEIGDEFGSIDLAAIPIGAYHPRWFLKPQHTDPEEAVKVHRDIHAINSFGIHWGTFVLSQEPYYEPAQEFLRAAKAYGLDDGVHVPLHGLTTRIEYGVPLFADTTTRRSTADQTVYDTDSSSSSSPKVYANQEA